MQNEGREVELLVKSKAPFDEFGHMLGKGPYEGDGNDATFNPDPINEENNETARVYFTTNIDTRLKTLSDTYGDTSGTTDISTGEIGKALVKSNATYNKETNEVSFDYHGSNPLVHGAPEIDVEGKLKFTNEKNGNLHIQGTLNGDGFPATGASVHFDGSKANGVMLGSSPIEAGTSKDYGPVQLIDLNVPFTQKEIMNINLSIGFEGKTPVSVKDIDANKSYSVEGWNAMHAGKSMVDCLENVDNHVTTPNEKECITEALFVSDKGIVLGGEYTKNVEDIQVRQTGLEENQSFDSTTKAQEIVANMNLPEYDNSMDYNNSSGLED